MENIIRLILDRKLADFRGTEIKGKIVASDELVNELLTELLTKSDATVPAEPLPEGAAPPTEPVVTPAVDLAKILSYLDVHHLRYRTEDGRTVLELNMGI